MKSIWNPNLRVYNYILLAATLIHLLIDIVYDCLHPVAAKMNSYRLHGWQSQNRPFTEKLANLVLCPHKYYSACERWRML